MIQFLQLVIGICGLASVYLSQSRTDQVSVAEFLTWVEEVHAHQSFLQRHRSILLRLVEQPNGQGARPTWEDQRQVNSRFDAGGGSDL